MSLTKAMDYEATPISKPNAKRVNTKLTNNLLEQMSSLAIVWFLVKRHKVGILAIGNLVLIANFIFPEWPQLVLGLIGK